MMSNNINFDHIFLDVKATNKKQLFKNMARIISEKTGLNENKLLIKIISQEKRKNSAIGNGVALSNLQFSEVSDPQFILCRFKANNKTNTEFKTPDNMPIDLFCLILSSKESYGSNLQLVSSLSRIMNDPFLCDQIRCLKSEDDIYNIMSERQIIRHAA